MAKSIPLSAAQAAALVQLTGSKAIDDLTATGGVTDTDRGYLVQGTAPNTSDVKVTELQRFTYIFGKMPAFVASGTTHAKGLVPDPGATAGTTRFLREDGGWTVPAYTTYNPFGGSGTNHASGLVPDPGATAGTTRFLREDGGWSVPAYMTSVFGGSGTNHAAGLVPDPGATAGTTRFLREDGGWTVPAYTSYAVFGASGASHSSGLVPDPGVNAGTTRFLREDGTFAVPAGGGGGASIPRHPGYVSTNWYRPGRYTAANGAVNGDVVYFLPLVIDQDATITDLGVRVVTGVASTSLLMGVYTNSNSRPGNLIASVPATSTATTGSNATSTFASALFLSAGIYWVAALCNGAPTLTAGGTTDPQITALIGQVAASVLGQSVAGLVASSPYANGLPSTAPATGPTTAGCPLIHFKAQ